MKGAATGFKIGVGLFICLCFIGVGLGIPLAAAGLGAIICLVSPIALSSYYRRIGALQRQDKRVLIRKLLFMESLGVFSIIYAEYWRLELPIHGSAHARLVARTAVLISILVTVLLGIRATFVRPR